MMLILDTLTWCQCPMTWCYDLTLKLWLNNDTQWLDVDTWHWHLMMTLDYDTWWWHLMMTLNDLTLDIDTVTWHLFFSICLCSSNNSLILISRVDWSQPHKSKCTEWVYPTGLIQNEPWCKGNSRSWGREGLTGQRGNPKSILQGGRARNVYLLTWAERESEEIKGADPFCPRAFTYTTSHAQVARC